MISKFQDISRAVGFLCGAMREHARDTYIDVSYFTKGETKKRSSVVSLGHLRSTLDSYCERFSEAAVVIDPLNQDQAIGAIMCRCQRHVQRSCPQHCRHHQDRPIICVISCSQDHLPTDSERMEVLHLFHEMFHKYQVDYNKNHAAAYGPQSAGRMRKRHSLK